MDTDPNEVVNSVGAYTESCSTNMDEYVYQIHKQACTNIRAL